MATPDPLEVAYLTRTLTVVSAYGTPSPAVGAHTYTYGTALNPGVDASVTLGTTQYVCTGWSLLGQEPSSGFATSFSMTLTADAVLTWNWELFNIAPQIVSPTDVVALRTAVNTLAETLLIGRASDADGDDLAVTAVDGTSALGGSVVRDGGLIIYTPPGGTSSLQDSFGYTITDEHGAPVQGTVNVSVPPGATLIRVH